VSEEKRIIIDGGRLGGKALAIAAGAALSKARTESDRPIIVYDEEEPPAPAPTTSPRKPRDFLEAMSKVPTLRLWGDPVLETLCEKVDDFGADLQKLVADLKARLGALPYSQKGYALAAPQIGEPKAVAYVRCPEQVTKAKAVLHEFVMVNPAIVRKGKKIRVMEGCLSIPHFFHTIERRHDLTVVYKDETGVVRSLNAKGRLAQVIQHEVDHLLGTLMVNHVKERQGRRLAEREIRRYRK
jgi:peptide deformylase